MIRYKRTPDLEQVQKDFGIIKVAELVEAPLVEPKTHLVSDAFIVETDTNEQKYLSPYFDTHIKKAI